VIYIIENNGYSMGTSQARSSAFNETLAARAEGYNMAWDVINGEDIYEVRAKTKVALDRAHNESRPTLLELDTYRYEGHSVADANKKKYRTEEEIENYRTNHDPLRLWKRRLIEEGVIDEETSSQIDKEAKDEAAESAKFANDSDFPSEESIFQDVYYEVDNDTESGRSGKHFFN
jgi:pyruvate dehydrogenase E1 component alpha subunit